MRSYYSSGLWHLMICIYLFSLLIIFSTSEFINTFVTRFLSCDVIYSKTHMLDRTVSHHDSIQAWRMTCSWLVIWTFVQWFMKMKYMFIRVTVYLQSLFVNTKYKLTINWLHDWTKWHKWLMNFSVPSDYGLLCSHIMVLGRRLLTFLRNLLYACAQRTVCHAA